MSQKPKKSAWSTRRERFGPKGRDSIGSKEVRAIVRRTNIAWARDELRKAHKDMQAVMRRIETAERYLADHIKLADPRAPESNK
jgi:hypothetical protein